MEECVSTFERSCDVNRCNPGSSSGGLFIQDGIVIKSEPPDQVDKEFEPCNYEHLLGGSYAVLGKSDDPVHSEMEVDGKSIKTESTEVTDQCSTLEEHFMYNPRLDAAESKTHCANPIPSISGSWLSSLKSKLQTTIILAEEVTKKKDPLSPDEKKKSARSAPDSNQIFPRKILKKEGGCSLKGNDHRSVEPSEKKELTQCQVCEFKTVKKSQLVKHLKEVHIRVKTLSCDKCKSFKTLSRDELNRHMKEHSDNFSLFNCSLCSFKSVWEKGLVAHINTVHTSEKLYHCFKCVYVSQTRTSLDRHYDLEHGGQKPFQCHDCSFQAAFKRTLLSHINRRHNPRIHVCSECGFTTVRSKDLRVHVRSVHEKVKYSCFNCNLQTSTEKELVSHIEASHRQSLVYGCNDCGFRTSTKKQISYHIKRIHDCCSNERIRHQCHHCDNSYFSKKHLKRHIITAHLEFVKYKCYVCNYRTNVKKYFKRHVVNKHKKIKRYECLRCDFKSYLKSALDIHVVNEHLETKSVQMPTRSIFKLWKDELKRQIYEKDISKNILVKEEFKIF